MQNPSNNVSVRKCVLQYTHRYLVQSVAEYMFGNLLGHKKQNQVRDIAKEQQQLLFKNLGVESWNHVDVYPEHELTVAVNLLSSEVERQLQADRVPVTMENVEYLCDKSDSHGKSIIQDLSKQLYGCLSILRSHYYKDLQPHVTNWMDKYCALVHQYMQSTSMFSDDLDTLLEEPMEQWESTTLSLLGTPEMITEKVRGLTGLSLTEYSWPNVQYVLAKTKAPLQTVQLDKSTRVLLDKQFQTRKIDTYQDQLSVITDAFTGTTWCNRMVYQIKNMTSFKQIRELDTELSKMATVLFECKDVRGLPDTLYSNVNNLCDFIYSLGYCLAVHLDKRYSTSILLDEKTIYTPVFNDYREKYPERLLKKYYMAKYRLAGRSLPSYGISVDEICTVSPADIDRELEEQRTQLSRMYKDTKKEAESLAFREILQELAAKHQVPHNVLNYYYNEFSSQHQMIDHVLTKFFIREVWKDTVMEKYYTTQYRYFTEQIQKIGVEQLSYVDEKMRNTVKKEVEFMTFLDWIYDYFSQILRRVV